MKEINPERPLDQAARAQIQALAQRQQQAQNGLFRAATALGNRAEDGLAMMPEALRQQVERAAAAALRSSYDLAARGRSEGPLARLLPNERAHKLAATLSGAVGGAGGMATSLAELPLATTMIFGAIQQVAADHGEDPTSPEIRLDCLTVFGAGGPGSADDGIDTSFVGARMALSGTAVRSVIAKVAPRFAGVIGQKLASQAVPVLGALAGAGTNYAFVSYYTQIAHVHFGLRGLIRQHGHSAVTEAFQDEIARLMRPRLKA